MKGIFRAIARALRAVMRRLKATAARGAGVVDGAWASLFGGGGYVEEEMDDAYVDQPDTYADQSARQVVDNASAPADFSPAILVKRAVELRDLRQPFESVFDMTDPEQKRLAAYVAALDESAMRLIRHMPIHSLEHHLDSSPFCMKGLRPIDMQIAMAREEAEAKATAAQQKADGPRRPRRRETPVTAALAAGRALTLDELISSRRLARS